MVNNHGHSRQTKQIPAQHRQCQKATGTNHDLKLYKNTDNHQDNKIPN